MIRIVRGAEPPELAEVRGRELPKLRALARERAAEGKGITGDDITGYQVASLRLWQKQHHKCCYCEHKIQERHNDVEHHRPKGRANRAPGSTATHGYWWLAFDWDNLLYACPSCNRSEKNDLFPLPIGDAALEAEERPPGNEHPHLLDPASTLNPVEHIEFEYRFAVRGQPAHSEGKQWFARPRDNSLHGFWTIHVCGLNHADRLELRKDHVRDYVQPLADSLNEAIGQADEARVRRELRLALTMLRPTCYYVALTYDAFRLLVPDATLARWELSWPDPSAVGLPPRPQPVRRRLAR